MLEDPQQDLTPESEPQPVDESPGMDAPASPELPVEDQPVYFTENRLDLTPVRVLCERVKEELQRVIVGQDEYIELLLAALLANGHVLVEGVPGIAKTLTAKLLAQTLEIDYARIQFTPDLMPSDVLGTTVYNLQTSAFSFAKGPIFANVVLIDEINRAPAKTQAALFEVMEEQQVTVDGTTYPFDPPFFVVATQNPIEQEGTYKLPEAQLDRFLIKIKLDYPSLGEEQAILKRFRSDFELERNTEIKAVCTAREIMECRKLVEQVHIKEELLDYIGSMVHDTRHHADLFLGASPRASLAILKMAKATAAQAGRDFVTPDDIQYVAYPVLNHRIILTPEREMEGARTEDVIKAIVQKIEVPR